MLDERATATYVGCTEKFATFRRAVPEIRMQTGRHARSNILAPYRGRNNGGRLYDTTA